jgi:hypothetical protein
MLPPKIRAINKEDVEEFTTKFISNVKQTTKKYTDGRKPIIKTNLLIDAQHLVSLIVTYCIFNKQYTHISDKMKQSFVLWRKVFK